MSLIGELAVNVVANVGGLTRGLNTASRSVSSFGRQLSAGNFTGAFSGLSAQLGVTAGLVNGLASGVQNLWETFQNHAGAIDAVGKLGARINIATEDLIGLRHAADQTGAGAETLDYGLEQLTRRLGEVVTGGAAAAAKLEAVGAPKTEVDRALQGLGRTAQILEQLGFNARELARENPAEAFLQLSEAIKGLPTQAEKSAAAFALFGERGQKLVNTLDVGRKGLVGYLDEAKKLGITYSAFDASQVEAANDSVDRLTKSLRGFGAHVAIDIAPAVKSIADTLTEITKTSGPGLRSVFKDIGTIMAQNVENVQTLSKWFEKLWKIGGGSRALQSGFLGLDFSNMTPEFAKFKTQAQGDAERERERAAAGAAGGISGLANQETGLQEHRAWLKQQAESLTSAFETPMESFQRKWTELRLLLDSGAIGQALYNRALAGYREELRKADPVFKQHQEALQRARSIYESTRTPLEEYASGIAELRGLLAAGVLDPDTAGRQAAELRKKAIEAIRQEDFAGAGGSVGAAVRGSAEAFSTANRTDRFFSEQRRATAELRKIFETLRRIEQNPGNPPINVRKTSIV